MHVDWSLALIAGSNTARRRCRYGRPGPSIAVRTDQTALHMHGRQGHQVGPRRCAPRRRAGASCLTTRRTTPHIAAHKVHAAREIIRRAAGHDAGPTRPDGPQGDQPVRPAGARDPAGTCWTLRRRWATPTRLSCWRSTAYVQSARAISPGTSGGNKQRAGERSERHQARAERCARSRMHAGANAVDARAHREREAYQQAARGVFCRFLRFVCIQYSFLRNGRERSFVPNAMHPFLSSGIDFP